MALNCGIVGLPNVGKSTIFSSLSKMSVPIENYPFCTIEPSHGITYVYDERLDKIHHLIPAEKKTYATIEFVDIAGLVPGASKGEGLGNQFLANIRETGIIIHVVRCFEDNNIVHIAGNTHPLRDIESISLELIMADCESVKNQLEKNVRLMKNPHTKDFDHIKAKQNLLEKIKNHLEQGKVAKELPLEETEIEHAKDFGLLTLKPELLVCNTDEKSIITPNKYVEQVQEYANLHNTPVINLCGKLEYEISQLTNNEERQIFLQDAGITKTGLEQLSQTGYHMLKLKTFFTVGGIENKAWTFKCGDTAPQAAGYIHSDFQKGFIRAEVYNCNDLFSFGSEKKIKTRGKLRQEGKNYLVQDGDILFFKFNL